MSAPGRPCGPSFSPRVWNQVPATEVQAVLRQFFGAWGLPDGLRLDNGKPWGGWNDLPTAWALWLAGLPVALAFNPPRQPRYNGVVEKSHDTAQAWAEPGRCASVEQLQRHLDEVDRVQREEYPRLRGLTRAQLWPGLSQPRRGYTPAWEEAHWSLVLAEQYLAEHVAVRKVDAGGRVWLYAQRVGVGRRHSGRSAHIGYDAEQHDWVVTDEHGSYWVRVPAPEICREQIVGLKLGVK
jgi:hypothetical protein